MIDAHELLERKEELKANLELREIPFDFEVEFERFETLYQKRKELMKKLQELQELSNSQARAMASADATTRPALIAKGKELKQQVSETKTDLEEVQSAYDQFVLRLPNWTHPSVPAGGEADFKLLKQHLEPRAFDFPVKDHLELMEKHDLLDFEKGAKVAGSKFYFLKNEAVLLEEALTMYALNHLRREGFTLMRTPDLAKTAVIEALGFSPKGPESQIYRIEEHDLNLIGTSEITLGGYYAKESLDLEQPKLLVGLSHCFRTEGGAYGSHSKGLYRVHQFAKIELFVLCRPEESAKEHERLLALEEALLQPLGLPYRVIDVAAGDLGAPASRKFDIEVWMPGREGGGAYGEVTSASNCLDFQARRLQIRTKNGQGEKVYAHTLNATALAMPRIILALIENGQQSDGSILLPPVLYPYLPFEKIGF